jgi:signal peptidase I
MNRSFPAIGLLFLALMVAGCSAASRLAVQPVRMQGTAMKPALKDGDRLFISRDVRELRRGDIIAFYYPRDQSKSYIKRIVGMPGETVEVRGDQVLINGQALEEPYVAPENNLAKFNAAPVKVPSENYYVMGDNRDYSNDSRAWGTLPRTLIYGKFVSKYAEGTQ